MSNFVSTITCTYGYVFKIVSNSHSIEHVTAALFTFIQQDMVSLIQALSPSALLSHTQALLDKYLLPSVDLHDEAKYHWDEIETSRHEFQLYRRKAVLLQSYDTGGESSQTVLVADLVAFCHSYFVNATSSRMFTVTAGHSSIPVPVALSLSSSSTASSRSS